MNGAMREGKPAKVYAGQGFPVGLDILPMKV